MPARTRFIGIGIFLIFVSLLPLFLHSFASSNGYVRLDRSSSNATLSGLVCVKPTANNSGQNSISITFPSSFSLDTNLSDWATSTATIPSGTSAYPEISSTPTSVSGSGVIFSSSQLPSNTTTYCFTFTAGSSTTGLLTGNDLVGNVTTKSSGTTLESIALGFSLSSANADQIAVTASISPHASDYALQINQDNTATIHQNTSNTYTITYGSHLLYTDQLIIEAQWYQGTLSGAGVPSVDGLEYVTSSATHAFQNTPPVVDLINNKIRWTISAFSANTTNQTVSFQLKTNASYTGADSVTFPIKVRLISPQFTTPSQTISTIYQYTQTPIPTPTITPTPPLGTGTPTPTLSSTPSLNPSPFAFTALSLRGITSTTAQIFVQTNEPSTIALAYGTSTKNLGNTLHRALGNNFQLSLDSLQPETSYIFQVTATDETGATITSDLLNFTSAAISSQPELKTDSLTFISANISLYRPKPTKEGDVLPKAVIILPQNTSYNFRFQLTKPETIKKVQVVVRNKFVLGISTENAQEPNTQITDLIETQNGVYEGRLKAPPIPGSYETFARIYDINGNIVERKLADVIISQPFRVYNKDNQQPIEAAQVLLYYQNFRTKQYALLPPQLFPIRNPSYTNLNGQIIFPLPQGVYTAHLRAIGFREKDISFTLGTNPTEDYPAVLLTPEPFNLITLWNYYSSIITDSSEQTRLYVLSLSYSVRFLELNAVIATSILVFLTLLSFSSRIHIPLRFLFSYFVNFSKITSVQRKLGDTIKGRIFDSSNSKEVPNALIYLVDADKETILAHTTSDTGGNFFFTSLPTSGYDIQVMADGFEPTIFHESEIHAIELGGYLLSIKPRQTPPSLFERIEHVISKLLAVFFETLLVASFVFELSLGIVLGWEKTIIFFIFSTINLLLWILHMTHLQAEKNIF